MKLLTFNNTSSKQTALVVASLPLIKVESELL